MRTAVALGASAALAAFATQSLAGNESRPFVSCDRIIGQATTGREGGYRVLLGVVSVPPARLTQVVDSGSGRWPYWRKAGLVIRANALPVRVTVPRAWRKRVAITWGNSGTVSGLTVGPCPSPPQVWNAYAGGFYLRARNVCAPLTFTVGARSQTVRFGLGRACARR